MHTGQFRFAVLSIMVFALAGCIDDEVPGPIGMSNPASDHCAALGGRTIIETVGDGSQIGMCHLPDGRVCEEWALFRDRVCEPADTSD